MSVIDTLAITLIVMAAVVTDPSYAGPPTMASNTADDARKGVISGRDSARQDPSGIRGALPFKPYNLHETDLLSSDIIGLAVYNRSNQKVGLVDDIILGSNQAVNAIVINVGGFLGTGNRDIAVAANSVLILKQGGRLDRALIDATEETLRSTDTFTFPAANRGEPAASTTPPSRSGRP
jgi:PRC-barrel domain